MEDVCKRLLKEDGTITHEVKIRRNLGDFNIGNPIQLDLIRRENIKLGI